MAKLTPKCKGPYSVVTQLGTLNYQVVMEETGEDVRTVNVCNLKPCYTSAEELESQERRSMLALLLDSSEDEEFKGLYDLVKKKHGGKSVAASRLDCSF